jgi:acyl carrier protein
MTRDEIRRAVLRLLCEVAPEINPAELKSDVNFRDQIDIDSMDFLNFLIAVHKELGVEIPEADYPRLVTLDACVDYLSAKLAQSAHPS